MNTAIGYILSYGFIGCVFILSIIAGKMKVVGEEGARKIIHILVCFTWVIMEKVFDNRVHTVIIPVTFVFINLMAMKKQIIPGMYREKNDTYGTVLYAISLALMNLVAYINDSFVLPAGMGIFALSFGDGFAAINGRLNSKYNASIKKGKSLFGTVACFIFSLVGIWIVCFLVGSDLSILLMLLLAAISTIMELIGGKIDNLLVPLGVFMISSFVMPWLN